MVEYYTYIRIIIPIKIIIWVWNFEKIINACPIFNILTFLCLNIFYHVIKVYTLFPLNIRTVKLWVNLDTYKYNQYSNKNYKNMYNIIISEEVLINYRGSGIPHFTQIVFIGINVV